MTNTELKKIIFNALEMINHTRTSDNQIPISEDTPLYSKQGYLDSMDLVSVLVDIEDELAEHGINVSLSDDKAMSQTNSPFKDVHSLLQFINAACTVEI
ncbi:hypothetical protein [Alteromonas sp. H39]|uniref:hypothetical protein n=1 Tax=Alteromonas sp. H39 TaxID=3389876 RepID=UPI0039E0BA82